jgi:hypothetical protein
VSLSHTAGGLGWLHDEPLVPPQPECQSEQRDPEYTRISTYPEDNGQGTHSMLRLWYGRDLRNTPRWAIVMRKLNLPEA